MLERTDTFRYSVNVCDWCQMPLESCPTCGYALSVLDHHCRHCLPRRSALAKAGPFFDMKQLATMVITAVALTVVIYLIFFR